MKIGILGTGDVGRILAEGFSNRGHEVVVGTRNPEAPGVQETKAGLGNSVGVANFADAARHGEVVIAAIGGNNMEGALRLAGIDNFDGKVVIDTSNPITMDNDSQHPRLTVGHTDSNGERVQRWLPRARVVKAFNSVGYAHMVEPDFDGTKPDMFICGNDTEAKRVTTRLIRELGWPDTLDLGDIGMARYLEPLAMVWITCFINNGFNPNHAFKLLRK